MFFVPVSNKSSFAIKVITALWNNLCYQHKFPYNCIKCDCTKKFICKKENQDSPSLERNSFRRFLEVLLLILMTHNKAHAQYNILSSQNLVFTKSKTKTHIPLTWNCDSWSVLDFIRLSLNSIMIQHLFEVNFHKLWLSQQNLVHSKWFYYYTWVIS